MATRHVPVLLSEALAALALSPGRTIVDGTVGGGGHARAILEATAPNGQLVAFDRDPAAVARARQALAGFGSRVTFVTDSYANLGEHLPGLKVSHLDGVLLDLGLSSDQLDDATRGFSFQGDAPLDLRFDPRTGRTAADLLQNESAEFLTQLLRDGDELQARALVKRMVSVRRTQPFRKTSDLLQVVHAVKGRGHRTFNPATLVWQALRLAVNDELGHLAQGLASALTALGSGGRLVVITFHSGEDRLVKQFFRRESKGCLCPPELPTCCCGHVPQLRLLTPRPILPADEEVSSNPRARSAKLRAATKL